VIIDGLTFLGDSIFGHRTSAAHLLAALDEARIERAIACPAKPRDYRLGPQNERLAEAVREHAARIVGFARVDPLLGDEAAAEADAALGELGLAGLFLHPWEETFRINAPLVDGVVEVARAHGAPVIVATGYPLLSEALQVSELARRFPEVTFLMTNGGQLNISGLGQTDAELALATNDNLLVQTAGVYREDFLEGVVRRFGAERLVFATGFPLLDARFELARARALDVDAAERARIVGGNLAALLGA
jgi:predicted TIM-barrel fold metal-dependent hydrolase